MSVSVRPLVRKRGDKVGIERERVSERERERAKQRENRASERERERNKENRECARDTRGLVGVANKGRKGEK